MTSYVTCIGLRYVHAYITRGLYATYVRLIIGKVNVLQMLLCAVDFSQQKKGKALTVFTMSLELRNTFFFLLLALFKKRGNVLFSPPKGGGARTDLVTIAVFRQSQQLED